MCCIKTAQLSTASSTFFCAWCVLCMVCFANINDKSSEMQSIVPCRPTRESLKHLAKL